MSVSSEEKEENGKSHVEPVAISDIEEAIGEEAGDITDNEEAVEPTLKRRGLKRSYAMLDVLDMSGNDPADPDFEAPSEQEESASAVELYDDNETPKKKKKAIIPPVKETTSAGIVELDDEDETPKKKKKVPVSVREVIKAKRGQVGFFCAESGYIMIINDYSRSFKL